MLSYFNGHTIRRSPEKKPHYYQAEAVEAVEKSWGDGFQKSLLVIPTGGGKSLVTGELMARAIEKGERTLFLCHRRELVSKPATDFEEDFGCASTIEMGNLAADDSPAVFASVQTMQNRIKSGKWKPDTFRRICLDESHRSLGAAHLFVSQHFGVEGVEICGCTATPRRGDQKDLLTFFDNIAYDIPLDRLIREGFLSEIVIQEEPLNIEVHGKSKTGDITDEEAGEAIEPYLQKAADLTVKFGKGKCGLSFLPLRKLAIRFRDMLRERGMKAEYVAGASGGENCVSESEQKRIKRALEMGEIEHVCNAQLWGEGTDIRPLTFGVDLRPTRSWTEHMQKYGRFTRTFDPEASYAPKGCRWPKKTHATILDFCFAKDEHNLLQRPATIFAKDEQEAEAIQKVLKQKGGGNLLEALATAKSEREETLRKRLQQMQSRVSREVNAMDYFLSIARPDLAEYEPLARWEKEVVTDGQRDFLLRNGFDISTITSRGMASQIVDSIIQRTKAGLATIKQAKYAQSLGHPDPFSRSFSEIGIFITDKKAGRDPFAGIPDL